MSKHNHFHHWSYKKHARHYLTYSAGGDMAEHAKTWHDPATIGTWLDNRLYKLLDPLLLEYPASTWLTVGDGRYGNDARYIQNKGLNALPTDIADILLEEAKQSGWINDYRKENAESLSFADETFDFVLCKESYHHFPRPMLALYEMLRVCRLGIVLMEPNDHTIFSGFSDMLFFHIVNFLRPLAGKKFEVTNYEDSGNFVYKISKQEIIKAAMGMNLPFVAFKGMNDCYVKGVEYVQASEKSRLFKKIKRVIWLKNLLSKLKLRKHGMLVVFIFKENISDQLMASLQKNAYEITIPSQNPYT